jgi:hypothetical protein
MQDGDDDSDYEKWWNIGRGCIAGEYEDVGGGWAGEAGIGVII